MSFSFPTWKQFIGQKRKRLREEYPDAYANEREAFEDTLKLQVSEASWMAVWQLAMNAGEVPSRAVLDTLNDLQLYNLKKHYAPLESLDWYIPARIRTCQGLRLNTADATRKAQTGAKVSSEMEAERPPHFKEAAMKGKRVCSKQTGRTGTVTRAIGNCLWVRMDDDGSEWSGGKPYWKVLPVAQQNAGPAKTAPAI